MRQEIKKLFKTFCETPFPKADGKEFNNIFDMLIEIDSFFAGLISSYIKKGSVKITSEEFEREYIMDIKKMLSLLKSHGLAKNNQLLFRQYQRRLKIMQKLAYLLYEELVRKDRQGSQGVLTSPD